MLDILNLKSILIAAGASFSIGAFSAWWATAEYKNAKHDQIMSSIYQESAKAVQLASQKALEAERENNRLATEIEVQNAQNRKKLDDLFADNLRLAGEYAGLYDRHAAASDCAVPAAPSTANNAPAAPSRGKLSNELTQLLLSESRRADEAAEYARACYEWVKKLGVK